MGDLETHYAALRQTLQRIAPLPDEEGVATLNRGPGDELVVRRDVVLWRPR